jgi:dolichyl-phosphate beta-glucosyltransferase
LAEHRQLGPARTIIIVPCYNEARRLDVETFREFAAGDPRVRFLFCDDGSTDGTADVLESLRRSDPASFAVHRQPRNMGKAEAVRCGILLALEDHPDFVGFWDADLSTPLEELGRFRQIFEQRPDIEMVFGSRVNLLGRSVRRKLVRHYIGRVFATAVSAALRLPIYDTQCGAKVFRVTDGLAELFQERFISRWIFDVEIIARCIAARRRTDRPAARAIIYEHPLMRWFDVDGSKLRLRDAVIVSLDFIRIYLQYMRRPRPQASPPGTKPGDG